MFAQVFGRNVVRCSFVVAALCFPAVTAGAATIVVDPTGAGGALTSLQAALDAAAPGDTILVHGGTYGAITITKPVTIVGGPRPMIRPPTPDEAGSYECAPALTLAGSGIGAVTLVAVDVGGTAAADWFSTFGAGIEGGGFTMLQLQNCTVSGPLLEQANGQGVGGEGLATSIPLVFVSDSSIVGGANTTDTGCGPLPLGRAGVAAPNSVIVLLDSYVKGGAGSDTFACYDQACGLTPPAQPCPCSELGGYGGVGVHAQRVFAVGSVVEGGAGMDVRIGCGGASIGTAWGKQPDGSPYHASTVVVPMTNDLALVGDMKLGTTPAFAWPAGNGQLLLLSTSAPVLFELGYGPLFLDPSKPLFIEAIGSGVTSLSTPIPANAALIGVHVGVQVFDASGLSRPVIDVVKP